MQRMRDEYIPEILLSDDGSHTLHSPRYGVTYHSRFGAATESAHVFIAAGLRYQALLRRDIAVLETGLGTGLNALMTLLEAERRGLKVSYTGLETQPLALAQVQMLNYPERLGAEIWREVYLEMHRMPWREERVLSEGFVFCKKDESIEYYEQVETYDLIYFDAFAPQAQPELWTEEVMARMYRSLRPEGALVTYCAKGDVRRAMKAVGFVVEKLQGPPGKREMIRALK